MTTYNALGFNSTLQVPIIVGTGDEVNVPSLSIAGTSISATAAELNILDGVTATAAELNILDGVTSTAAELNILDGVTATTAELNYLDVTAVGTAQASKAIVLDSNKDVSGLRNLSIDGDLTVNGTTTTVESTVVTINDPIFTLGGSSAPASDDNKDRGIEFHWHNGSAAKLGFFGMDDTNNRFTFIPDATNTSEVFSGTKGDLDINAVYLATGGLYINNNQVSATAAELNILDGVTATTAELNILDGVTSTAAELNILDGVTATTAELNYLDGASANLATFSLPASTTISTFGASLVDDADASTARTTLGLGTIATQAANSVDIDGGAIDGAVIGANSAAAGSFTAIVGTSLDLNGDLDMSGAARDIKVASTQAAALEIKDDAETPNTYMTIDASNIKVKINQTLDVADDLNVILGTNTMVMSTLTVAGSSAVSAYDALYINTSGELAPADADGAGLSYNVVGFAMEGGPSGAAAAKQVAAQVGQATPMKFAANPSSGDEGKAVYLSTTAGQVSLTAPSSAGDKVFRVGFLLSTDPVDTGVYSVLFQPQFMAIA